MRHKIVVAGKGVYLKFFDLSTFDKQVRQADAEIVAFREDDEHKFLKVLTDADALILIGRPIRVEHLKAMHRCKIILAFSVGYDFIDIEGATERGIIVSNCPSYGREQVAVHAITLMLSVHRKLKILMEQTHQWSWDYNVCKPIGDIRGKNLGIIGLGKIGRTLALLVKSLNLNVLAYDPYQPDDIFELVGVTRRYELDELLTQADFISIHAPLTNETYHMIGAPQLQMMKGTAVLVNTARGKIIDEQALYQALENKTIIGAGLDVLEKEPPSQNNSLLTCERAVITPHIAWYSEESLVRLRDQGLEEVVRVLQGKRPRHIVNPAVL